MSGQPLCRGFVFIGLLSIAIAGVRVAAQSSTENEIWSEVNVHLQLPSHLRVLTFTGVQQAFGYPFQQWYAAGALGYQFKPMLRPHWENIDRDKEHYFLVGGGYEFLRTAKSGRVTHENRVTIDVTPSLRPWGRLLMRDRNWVEMRWINGFYSTTYRNMLSAEVDLKLHQIRFTPFGTVEAFYDGGDKHSWDQEWFTAGVQFPYKRIFMMETYYRRVHCSTCTPNNWNAAGLSLHIFFTTKE